MAAQQCGATLNAAQTEVASLARCRRLAEFQTAPVVSDLEMERVWLIIEVNLDPGRCGVPYDVHDGFPTDPEGRVFHLSW